ncbi:MAG: hypothetical protein ACRDUX_41335 [Mycobacterium sp.]
MLDYHPRSNTENWWEPQTRPAYVPGTDSSAATMAHKTAATMAQQVAAPDYAWSAEPVVAEYPMPDERSRRLLRPAVVACAVAAVAAAAALVVVLNGPTETVAVSTPNASTPIAHPQAAATAPAPKPAKATTSSTTQQVHHSQPSHFPQYQQPTSQPSSTASDDTGEQQPHQWQSWQNSSLPSWNWQFLRPHFNTWERHDRDQRNDQRSEQSQHHHFDSSTDEHQ